MRRRPRRRRSTSIRCATAMPLIQPDCFIYFFCIIRTALVLYFDVGKNALESVSAVVQNVISYSTDGISFLFGNLGTTQFGFIFAFQVLPVIIFFSSLMSVLYYLGIMQFVVRIIGEGIKRLMGDGCLGIKLGNQTFTPIEISSMILKSIGF